MDMVLPQVLSVVSCQGHAKPPLAAQVVLLKQYRRLLTEAGSHLVLQLLLTVLATAVMVPDAIQLFCADAPLLTAVPVVAALTAVTH